MTDKMQEIVEAVAGYMALSARTAPKTRGEDCLEIKVLTGAEVDRLGRSMVEFGEASGKPNFDRDGDNVSRSQAVLLLSLDSPDSVGLNCGACGFDRCADQERAAREGAEFYGPLCAWRVIDLGIALGSAVKTASLFNTDNRIMYRIGVVARKMGLIRGEIVLGVPVSATGKSIYFDR